MTGTRGSLRQLHPPERVAAYVQAGVWGAALWPDLLADHAGSMPSRRAVVDTPNYAAITGKEPTVLSWAELGERVRRLATVLRREGVRAGDVVGIQLPNGVDLTASYLAIATLGAVATPFPVQYREYELTQMCELAGVSAFLTGSRVGDHRTAEWAIAVHERSPALTRVLAFGSEVPEGALALDPALAGSEDTAALAQYLADLDVDANDAVTVCWTSGTESRPKGVPRCANDWYPMALSSVDAMQLTVDDVLLNPFPMVNMAGIGGMLVPWLLTGAVLVQHHPFDAGVFFRQLAEEGVTYTVAPPAVLVRALDMPQCTPESMASVRVIGSGSAPLPPSMIRTWRDRFGIDIVNCFGSNEGISLVSDARTVLDPEKRSTLFPRFGSPDHQWENRASLCVESQLIDVPTGEVILEAGRPGELRLRGPGVFSGYLEGTAAKDPFDDHGWFRTGDIFQYVEDQPGDLRFLQYVDRAKDLIIRGGMNISPAELENLIVAHPKVVDVAVTGAPDAALGERVMAVLVLAEDEELTLAELTSYLRTRHIASYKLPERLEVVPALPRNPVGKVLKRELRARLASPTP